MIGWQFDAGWVNNFHINAKHSATLFGLQGAAVRSTSVAVFGFFDADAANWRQLGHAPGV